MLQQIMCLSSVGIMLNGKVEHWKWSWFLRGLFFFQGPISRKIKTTVRIRWSFIQMCCTMSLVCPSITTHRTCQFWMRSEPLNMPKTIESRAKCGVRAVIRILYSEQATRNVVLRYCCSSSRQCSAAYCSCNKKAPEAFSIGSARSPIIIRPKLVPCDFHLFTRMKRSKKDNTRGQHFSSVFLNKWIELKARSPHLAGHYIVLGMFTGSQRVQNWQSRDRSRLVLMDFFQSVKILSMTSFGREVKPWVPCS